MATMMAPLGVVEPQLQAVSAIREVLRCKHCTLVQYRTATNNCRRCRKSLNPDPPKLAVPVAAPSAAVAAAPAEGLQVASAVRSLRTARGLSQRQLAGRMGVPRTYISKIENGKAMPTLGSLDRLARALQVDISALLRDSIKRQQNETEVLLADPFLAELAPYLSHLTATQKSIFLNQVRELAQNHIQNHLQINGQMRSLRTA